jgi:hypothetical protein
MAEFLVKAKGHWMDNFTQVQIDKLSSSELLNYNSRSQIGDIVVIRSNGWKWGKAECLPDFIVIKIPELTIEECKKYGDQLFDNSDPPKILKIRKFRIPQNTTENYATLGNSIVTIASGTQTTIFKNNIITKVS